MIGMHLPTFRSQSSLLTCFPDSRPSQNCESQVPWIGSLDGLQIRCTKATFIFFLGGLDGAMTGWKLKMEMFPTGCFYTRRLDFRTLSLIFFVGHWYIAGLLPARQLPGKHAKEMRWTPARIFNWGREHHFLLQIEYSWIFYLLKSPFWFFADTSIDSEHYIVTICIYRTNSIFRIL